MDADACFLLKIALELLVLCLVYPAAVIAFLFVIYCLMMKRDEDDRSV